MIWATTSNLSQRNFGRCRRDFQADWVHRAIFLAPRQCLLLWCWATWREEDITCPPAPAAVPMPHQLRLSHHPSFSDDVAVLPLKRCGYWYRLISWGDRPTFPNSPPRISGSPPPPLTETHTKQYFILIFPQKALSGMSGSVSLFRKAPAATSKCSPATRAWKRKICAFALMGNSQTPRVWISLGRTKQLNLMP